MRNHAFSIWGEKRGKRRGISIEGRPSLNEKKGKGRIELPSRPMVGLLRGQAM